MKNKKKITRRKFIKDTSVAAIGGTLLLNSQSSLFASTVNTEKSDVVLIRNKEVLGKNGTPDSDIVLAMLDEAVSTLTKKKDAVAGWKTLIKSSDIVGIKSNVWSLFR